MPTEEHLEIKTEHFCYCFDFSGKCDLIYAQLLYNGFITNVSYTVWWLKGGGEMMVL